MRKGAQQLRDRLRRTGGLPISLLEKDARLYLRTRLPRVEKFRTEVQKCSGRRSSATGAATRRSLLLPTTTCGPNSEYFRRVQVSDVRARGTLLEFCDHRERERERAPNERARVSRGSSQNAPTFESETVETMPRVPLSSSSPKTTKNTRLERSKKRVA